jgi:hypothetical protein
MLRLPPPRHISTLPTVVLRIARYQPVSDPRVGCSPLLPKDLDLGLLVHLQGIVDFDIQLPDCAFHFV